MPLILKRNINETIMIGNTAITIHSIRGNQVRLAIEAPDDVVVDRLEVHLRKKKEREANERSNAESDQQIAAEATGSSEKTSGTADENSQKSRGDKQRVS